MVRKKTKARQSDLIDASVDGGEDTDAGGVEAEFLQSEELVEARDYSHLPLNEQAAFRCKDTIAAAWREETKAMHTMALCLLEAYENEYAKIWNYESFSDYVEHELDISVRQAYYMTDIGKLIRKFNIPPEQIQEIGWTKMRRLVQPIQQNPDGILDYLDMARTMTRNELEDALKDEIVVAAGKEAVSEKLRIACTFEGHAASVVQDAVSIAYGDTGEQKINLAIQHIAGEWLVARGASDSKVTLEDWLNHLEKTFKVRLVRAENEDSIDSLITGPGATAEDDRALEELLESTPDELAEYAD